MARQLRRRCAHQSCHFQSGVPSPFRHDGQTHRGRLVGRGESTWRARDASSLGPSVASDNFGGEWHCLRMSARWMYLGTHDPFRPLTHVRSALQVSERRNELHGVRRPPRRGGAKVVVCRLRDFPTDLRVRSPAATVPAGRVDQSTIRGLQRATEKVCTPALKPTPSFERASGPRADPG